MYGVDYASLSPLYQRRVEQPGGWPRQFLFVGRYVEDKAIDVLIEAYAQYRAACESVAAYLLRYGAAGAAVEESTGHHGYGIRPARRAARDHGGMA